MKRARNRTQNVDTFPTNYLMAGLLAVAVSACLTDGDQIEPDLGVAHVNLSVNDLALVTHFDLHVRDLSSSSWNTQTLTPAIVGSRVEASSTLTMNAGTYIFRAEAYTTGPFIMGQPREVRVDIASNTVTPVQIDIDISSFGDGGEQTGAAVTATAQNGADITQSSITTDDPTDVVSTAISIDGTSDFEGDPIRTGFVGEVLLSPAEFFSEASVSTTFTINAAPFETTVWAIAVDDQSMGTAHAYTFDPSVSPSLTSVETYRVNDVRAVNSGTNNLVVLSNDSPHTLAWADWDGDSLPDAGIDTPQTLLSWGPHQHNPDLYILRFMDGGGVITVATFDFNFGVVSTIAE